MNDVQWLKLDVTLPHYMEKVLERSIDLGNEDELQRFHQFRNDVEKLIDQYYGGNNG
jgi:hypothetical protein